MKQLQSSDSHTRLRRLYGLATSAWGAIVLLGVVLLVLSMASKDSSAKAPTPPPQLVLPNARYTLNWLSGPYSNGQPRDINNWGIMVGFHSGSAGLYPIGWTAFYTVGSITYDLNGLSAVWQDLDVPTELASSVTGWWAVSAYGINDSGDIVGVAENIDPNVPSRGFILENAFSNNPPPRFLLLPTKLNMRAVDHSALDINNNREVVVNAPGFGVIRYKPSFNAWPSYVAVLEIVSASAGATGINDSGVIVAYAPVGFKPASYRQKISGTTPEYFDGHSFLSIGNGIPAVNSIPAFPAMIGGSRAKSSGKNAQAGGAIRFLVTASAAQLVYSGTDFQYSRAINDYGDLCFEASARGNLFYDPDSNTTNPNPYGTSGNGVLPLDQMVLNPDADWLVACGTRLDGINNRNATGLGQICGYAYGPGRGFVLTPQ